MTGRSFIVRFVGAVLAILGVGTVSSADGAHVPLFGGAAMIALGAVLVLYGDGS